MTTQHRTQATRFIASIMFALALCACQRSTPPTSATATAALTPMQTCQRNAALPAPAAPASAAPSDKSNPRLKVTTIDGKPYDLADQCGHWVVVNFWATWCGPCLQEMPELTAFTKTRKDVAVIGLDFEEIERPVLEAFLKEHHPGYPIALVDTYHPPADFDTPRALPASYLIGPDGARVYKFLGPITLKELRQQIDKATGHASISQ
jgi:thiol-disulfide isomerase/thioredoxin